MDRGLLERLNSATAARRACVVITQTSTGDQQLHLAGEAPRNAWELAAQGALRENRSGLVEVEGRELLLTVVSPPLRLYLIGGVHVAQALAPMARLVGLDVTVVDPREAFVTPERFSDARLVARWPQEFFEAERLDDFSAVALLSHNPKIDDPALFAALDSNCFYIGALGSRRTHEARLARLETSGRAGQAARIRAPIGLDIGADAPAEIAVAALAEIVSARRGGPKR